jgi:hypothetical protein
MALPKSKAVTTNKKPVDKKEENEELVSKFNEKDMPLGAASKISSAAVAPGQGNVNVF